MNDEINNNGLVKEKIFVQKRRVRIEEFETLNKGLYEYLLELRENGMSEFDVENDMNGEWVKYEVELLRITVRKSFFLNNLI